MTTTEVTRLGNVTFTNGMMVELRRRHSFVDNDGFFNFMKLHLPQHLVKIIENQTVKQFNDKVKYFDGMVKKYRKTPPKFKDFCLDEYNFGLADRSNQTAGRRLNVAELRVAAENEAISIEKNDLKIKLEVTEEKLLATEFNLVKAEECINNLNLEIENKVILNDKVKSLEQKTRQLSCQVKGYKSGKVRSAAALGNSLQLAKSQKLDGCSTADKNVGTSLSLCNNDLVVVESSEAQKTIFDGKILSDFGGRKSTSGHVSRFASIGQKGNLPCGQINKKEIQKRSKMTVSLMKLLVATLMTRNYC